MTRAAVSLLPVRKLVYRVYRVLFALRHWVRRRFTRPGLAVLGGAIVAATLAVDPELTLAYQAFGLLSALLLVSMLASRFFRARFEVARVLPRFGTVGCPLPYRIVLKNLTALTQRGLVVMEDMSDQRPSLAEFVALQAAEERRLRSFKLTGRRAGGLFEIARIPEAHLPTILPRHEIEVPMELMPLRRGKLKIESVSVGRPDPLGLFKAVARFPAPQSVLILPKRYPLPQIALPGARKYQRGGVALASAIGESDEFVSTRDYRHGDPLRHIHWRSWAKAGRPIVKEFQDEFFVRHALILDTFTDHPRSEPFEEAVSVAASFACTVLTQESLLDLLFVGRAAYCFTAGRGVAHTEQMLEILASARPCTDMAFESLEALVLDHVSVVSGCVAVLIAWDDQRQRLVRRLRLLNVPVLVLVVTEMGHGAKLNPGPMEDEPHRFHALELGAIKEGLSRI